MTTRQMPRPCNLVIRDRPLANMDHLPSQPPHSKLNLLLYMANVHIAHATVPEHPNLQAPRCMLLGVRREQPLRFLLWPQQLHAGVVAVPCRWREHVPTGSLDGRNSERAGDALVEVLVFLATRRCFGVVRRVLSDRGFLGALCAAAERGCSRVFGLHLGLDLHLGLGQYLGLGRGCVPGVL